MPDEWRKWMGHNSLAPGMTASNVEDPESMSGVPVRSTGSGIVPAPDTSGLYAIYGRRNPYSARAARLGSMAGKDMGGRLGFLPGAVATLMAGQVERKAEDFEVDRQKKIDALLARKEEWDRVKNDEEAKKRGLEVFKNEVYPKMYSAFEQKYNETKGEDGAGDMQAAAQYATEVGNAEIQARNLPVPVLRGFAAFEGGKEDWAWEKSSGKIRRAKIDENGNMGIVNEKGETVPADSEDMLFSVYAKNQELLLKEKEIQARQARSAVSGLKGKEHGYLTAAGELRFYTDPDEAMKRGAVKVMWETRDEDGIMTSKEYWLPGKAPKEEAPTATPAQTTEEKPSMLGQVARVVGNALSLRPGGVARAAAQMGAPVPGGQQKTPAPQGQAPAQPIRRATPSGRIALYDPVTKEPLGWEK